MAEASDREARLKPAGNRGSASIPPPEGGGKQQCPLSSTTVRGTYPNGENHRTSAEPGKPLARELAGILRPATAVVCVGSELHGDDGVGVEVARLLADDLPWPVLDTRIAPESFVMKVAQAAPETVLVVDAMDLGRPPGGIDLVPSRDVAGRGSITHGPSLRLFLQALEAVHPCRCWVLGIQPKATDTGAAISARVASAARHVAAAITAAARSLIPE